MKPEPKSETSSPGRRLYQWLLGVPVSVKVMGIALGLAVMLGLGVLWQIHQTWHGLMLRNLESQGRMLSAELAARCGEWVRQGRRAELTVELQRALAETTDVAWVRLLGQEGQVLAEAAVPERSLEDCILIESQTRIADDVCTLRLGMSCARVSEEVGWLTRRLGMTTGIIGLLGMGVAWWLTRVLAHPIEELVTLTRAVKVGDYGVRAPVRAGDEVGELASSLNEMAGELARKEADRQALLRQVIQAGEEERKRLARELHDHTGQSLTAQIAMLAALERSSLDAAMRQRLLDVRQQTEATLREIHDLSVALRPPVLDDLGLMAALMRHCSSVGKTSGFEVDCAAVGLTGGRLPSDMETAVYRIVQEALTNVARHAGASAVHVLLHRRDGSLGVTIRDDGRGFDSRVWRENARQNERMGLLGIDERVALLGGRMAIESQTGQGTTLNIEFPLEGLPHE